MAWKVDSGLYSLLYTNVHSDIHLTTVQLREEPILSLLEGCSSGIMISGISDLPPEVLGLEKSWWAKEHGAGSYKSGHWWRASCYMDAFTWPLRVFAESVSLSSDCLQLLKTSSGFTTAEPSGTTQTPISVLCTVSLADATSPTIRAK